MEVGLIGLGTMGHNLALNIDDSGYKVHVFNRTSSKTEELVKERGSIQPHYSVKDLVTGINTSPKVIILMITSGDVIDLILDELEEYLSPEDIVIDGGNSSYKDTIRRCGHRFGFVGCGISGGEEGARNGPSIMVGCNESSWEKVRSLLQDISAVSKYEDSPCCVRLGENGAGHFVKMVHNGIEYGDMGLISEVYLILKSLELSNDDMSGVFDEWNKSDMESYLLGICCDILKAKNENGSIIDQVMDVSGQKGTGRETVISSMETSSPATAIVEAVTSRMISHQKEKRILISERVKKNEKRNGELSMDVLRRGFYLARLVTYVQGFNLLMSARNEHGWTYGIKDICLVWSNGCILRGSLLRTIESMSEERCDELELSSIFIEMWNDNVDELRRTVMYCIGNGIPSPTISSCLMYLDGLKERNGGGNMIQAMRDYFGSHKVRLNEGEETHVEWSQY